MNKKGISLAFGLGEFIGILITLGFIILIFKFIAGDVVKFNIEKENYEEAGKAINLLHAIATSSDLVEKDSINQPEKIVIDKAKLIQKDNSNKEMECCHYIDYDYYLRVKDLETSETFHLGFKNTTLEKFFKLGKKCGDINKNKFFRSYRIPIIISDQSSNSRNLGEMEIYLTKTPLSNIAGNLAIACLKSKYKTPIILYGLKEKSNSISIESNNNIYNICITSVDGNEMCKTISCDSKVQILRGVSEDDMPDDCKVDSSCALGCIEKDKDKVIIYVPEGF